MEYLLILFQTLKNRTQSITTSPLSNASFDAGQRISTIDEQPMTLQLNSSISADLGAFIPYNPARRKKRKDAPPNTCVRCYIKHRPVSCLSYTMNGLLRHSLQCQPSHDPSICGKCLGKGMYCMGDINLGEFADPGESASIRYGGLIAKCASSGMVAICD